MGEKLNVEFLIKYLIDTFVTPMFLYGVEDRANNIPKSTWFENFQNC